MSSQETFRLRLSSPCSPNYASDLLDGALRTPDAGVVARLLNGALGAPNARVVTRLLDGALRASDAGVVAGLHDGRHFDWLWVGERVLKSL
jgi:hypothetical protein